MQKQCSSLAALSTAFWKRKKAEKQESLLSQRPVKYLIVTGVPSLWRSKIFSSKKKRFIVFLFCIKNSNIHANSCRHDVLPETSHRCYWSVYVVKMFRAIVCSVVDVLKISVILIKVMHWVYVHSPAGLIVHCIRVLRYAIKIVKLDYSQLVAELLLKLDKVNLLTVNFKLLKFYTIIIFRKCTLIQFKQKNWRRFKKFFFILHDFKTKMKTLDL